MPAKKEKFIKEDHQGNYDIDGVSFDGEDVTVGSEKPNTSRARKKTNIKPVGIFILFIAVCVAFGLFTGLFGLSIFDNNVSETPIQYNQDLPNNGTPN